MWGFRMKCIQHSFKLICIGTSLIYSVPTQAGWLCDGLGIGCDPVSATGRPTDGDAPAPTMIDQNHPPEVFSFTVSGTFTKWSDIGEQTFVCDTRKREDRVCVWQGYIPEIKRNAVLSFKPFPHDQGMFKVRGVIANKFGKDTSYAGSISAPNGDYIMDEMSITSLSQHPFIIEYFASDYMGNIDFKKKHGHLAIAFKEVLK